MPSKIWNRCVAAVATAMVIAAGIVAAQEQQPAIPQGMEGFYGKESPQGVYVRDSAVALERFPLAQRLERMNEWGKAADVLQEVLEKYPDRVIPVGSNERSENVRYASIGTAVRQRISKWPQEGLAAYRARYELPAQALLESASPHDVANLRRVFSTYFNTESGKTAAMRLIDIAFRAGDFRAAADVADQLLNWHPFINDERPALLYRSALCAHLLGQVERSRTLLAELVANHRDTTGTIRGKDVLLAQSLEEELAIAPPEVRESSDENWPMFGGDLSRSRVSSSSAGTGAPLFSVSLSTPDHRQVPPDQRAALEAQLASDRREGATLGVMPVVDDGELFFQDGRRIYGVSLESGVPLPGWMQTHSGSGNGAYVAADCPPLPPGQQLNVTVTPGDVLAIIGFPDRTSPGGFIARNNSLSRVVCLDRATGAEKWVARPQDLPEDEGALRSLIFSGSPLVIGDNVHFLGRGGKGAQFEDCYLITLDRETGRHKWSTYIASSNTENMTIFGSRNATMSSDTTSHIAYASGRLFVATNLGVVAAVDAYTGSINWLSIYERNVDNDPMRARRFGGPRPSPTPKPYTFNAVMVQDDRLFVLPIDSNDLLIYDAVTGEPVKAIRRSHLDDPDMLVGVQGDNLVVSSDTRMYSINWSAYDADSFTADDDRVIRWPVKFPDLVAPVRGRPFMTTGEVFVPTARRLERIDARSGRRVGNYPAGNAEWSEEEGPGNIVIAGERVIVAGDRSVNVYTDLALARARLDAAVAAAPGVAEPRLRYAEVMFVAGETGEAMTRLDEAMELLGGADHLRPGPDRDRLFNLALAFARKCETRAASGEDGRELAMQFYTRATAAAGTPAQGVHLRQSRAEGAAEAEQHETVIAMYQEILSDASMRSVPLGDETGGSTQASVMAEREIQNVIDRHGREVYRAYDDGARKALEEAKAAGDADALVAVAHQFPNAIAAADALTAAAERYEQAGNHRMATQMLRQVAYRYPESFNMARGLEAMARNYLAMPNRVEVASSRLAYGIRTAGNPRLEQALPVGNGQVIPAGTSFSDALSILRQHTADAQAIDLPDFRLPDRAWTLKNPDRSPFANERTVPNIAALVRPQLEHPRHDRVITWSPRAGLEIYAVGDGESVGRTDAITAAPRDAAWLAAGLLIAAPHEIALIDAATAAPKWVTRLAELPAVEFVRPRTTTPAAAPEVVAGDNVVFRGGFGGARRLQVVNNRVVTQELLQVPGPVEGPEQVMQVSVTEDRVVAATSTGRLIAVDLGSGALAWQTRLLDGVPIDRIAANSDFTVARTITESEVQLVVLDSYSGQPITRRTFARNSGTVPVNFALAADGTLVYATPDRLCAKDLYEPGESLTWEIGGQSPGRRIFQDSTHPDQLKIADGRVIVVSNEGTEKQFVRLHSLETGRPIRYASGPGGREIDAPLQTEATGTEVRLFISRPYLYVMSQQMLIAYNLDRPEESWRGGVDAMIPHNMADVLMGSNHVLLLDASSRRADGQSGVSSFIVHAYSRKRVDGMESGLLDHVPTIQDDAGIVTWQGVEGGLYYLGGDNELHFLKGLGED